MIYLRKVPPEAKQFVADVFSGRYDLPVKFNIPPNILDIGADIGPFTVWASERWGGKVLAIEWHKELISDLQINIAPLKDKVGLLDKLPEIDKIMTDIDIVKISSEEVDEADLVRQIIVGGFRPRIIIVDYHGEGNRRAIDYILAPMYVLWGAKTMIPEQGTVKYVINSIKHS